MRIPCIPALAVLCLLGLPQHAPAQDAAKFAGAWEGSFKGTVFCVLQIAAGAEIKGTLRPGRVTADDDGEITDAEPSPPESTFPILNPKIDGKKLAFDWKEGDDGETLSFEFRITGENEGELELLGDEHIKPIPMRRAP